MDTLNKDAEDAADQDLATVLITASGRRFIWRLVDMFSAEKDTFSSDPYMHAYNAGQQSVGIRFVNLMKHKHFEHFQMMEREAHQAAEELDKL